MREAPRDEDGYMQRVPFVARQFGFLRPASRHVRLIVERLRATLQTRLPLPPAAPQLASEIEQEGSPGSERTLPTDCAPSDRVSTTSPGGSAATTKMEPGREPAEGEKVGASGGTSVISVSPRQSLPPSSPAGSCSMGDDDQPADIVVGWSLRVSQSDKVPTLAGASPLPQGRLEDQVKSLREALDSEIKGRRIDQAEHDRAIARMETRMCSFEGELANMRGMLHSNTSSVATTADASLSSRDDATSPKSIPIDDVEVILSPGGDPREVGPSFASEKCTNGSESNSSWAKADVPTTEAGEMAEWEDENSTKLPSMDGTAGNDCEKHAAATRALSLTRNPSFPLQQMTAGEKGTQEPDPPEPAIPVLQDSPDESRTLCRRVDQPEPSNPLMGHPLPEVQVYRVDGEVFFDAIDRTTEDDRPSIAASIAASDHGDGQRRRNNSGVEIADEATRLQGAPTEEGASSQGTRRSQEGKRVSKEMAVGEDMEPPVKGNWLRNLLIAVFGRSVEGGDGVEAGEAGQPGSGQGESKCDNQILENEKSRAEDDDDDENLGEDCLLLYSNDFKASDDTSVEIGVVRDSLRTCHVNKKAMDAARRLMIHHSRVLDTNVLDDMIALTTMALQRGMDATTATNAVLCVGDMFCCMDWSTVQPAQATALLAATICHTACGIEDIEKEAQVVMRLGIEHQLSWVLSGATRVFFPDEASDHCPEVVCRGSNYILGSLIHGGVGLVAGGGLEEDVDESMLLAALSRGLNAEIEAGRRASTQGLARCRRAMGHEAFAEAVATHLNETERATVGNALEEIIEIEETSLDPVERAVSASGNTGGGGWDNRAGLSGISSSASVDEAAARGYNGSLLDRERLSYIDFAFVRFLGSGTFGLVSAVRKTRGADKGLVFAKKAIPKTLLVKDTNIDHLKAEKRTLELCKHPFILKLHGTFQDVNQVYLVTELVPGGELWERISNAPSGSDDNRMAIADITFYSAIVVETLSYLHGLDLAHRDLKLSNLVIDAQGYLRLVDMGFTKKIPRFDRSYSFLGTPQYVAPELLTREGHGRAVDLWALGTLVYELATGQTMFDDGHMSNDEIFDDILDVKRRGLRFPKGFDSRVGGPHCRNLISQLMAYRPMDRLGNTHGGMYKLQSHAMFSGVDWDALRSKRLPPPWIPKASSYRRMGLKHTDGAHTVDGMELFMGDQEQFVGF